MEVFIFKDRRILFIAPAFFGYESDIKKELTALGAIVDYYDERPFTSSIAKILIRLGIFFPIRRRIKRHYDQILEHCNKYNYDYLFVVNPETINEEFVRSVKIRCKGIDTILYMWDSFKNKPAAKKLLPSFDKVFSFDASDLKVSNKISFYLYFITMISLLEKVLLM